MQSKQKIVVGGVVVLVLMGVLIAKRVGASQPINNGIQLNNPGTLSSLLLQVTDNEQMLAELKKRISGDQQKPSSEVFKNIKHFKDPSRRPVACGYECL